MLVLNNDDKVCSAISSYSLSQACFFVCGAIPTKEMNKSQVITEKDYEKVLTFGLSPIHSWIRFMECMQYLYIAYRLLAKVWQARSPENKKIVSKRNGFM